MKDPSQSVVSQAACLHRDEGNKRFSKKNNANSQLVELCVAVRKPLSCLLNQIQQQTAAADSNSSLFWKNKKSKRKESETQTLFKTFTSAFFRPHNITVQSKYVKTGDERWSHVKIVSRLLRRFVYIVISENEWCQENQKLLRVRPSKVWWQK